MKSWLHTFLLGAGFGTAFLVGRLTNFPGGGFPGSGGPDAGSGYLEAQGRGPTNPPPRTDPDPTPPAAEQPLVYTEDSGHGSSSTNGFLAVTGSYGVGTSVVYVIDTVNRQLAVYEARGGSAEQRRIVLVGARKIDLDLQLEGYNDRSEYEYRQLKDVFSKRGATDHDVQTGLEPGLPRRK